MLLIPGFYLMTACYIVLKAYSGWFYRFKDYNGSASNNSYNVPACDAAGKCSGFYHAPEHTPQYPEGNAMQGSCREKCDCGGNPCGASSCSQVGLYYSYAVPSCLYLRCGLQRNVPCSVAHSCRDERRNVGTLAARRVHDPKY